MPTLRCELHAMSFCPCECSFRTTNRSVDLIRSRDEPARTVTGPIRSSLRLPRTGVEAARGQATLQVAAALARPVLAPQNHSAARGASRRDGPWRRHWLRRRRGNVEARRDARVARCAAGLHRGAPALRQLQGAPDPTRPIRPAPLRPPACL